MDLSTFVQPRQSDENIMWVRGQHYKVMTCSTLIALYARVSSYLQIKNRGQYSDARLLALRAYADRTPVWQVALVLLLTPVPSLAIIVAVEIVPLADPGEGISANRSFYARMFLTYLVMASTLQQQFCTQVGPGLPTSGRTHIVGTLVVAFATMSAAYILALVIGFPVPFTMPITGPSYLLAEILVLGLSWKKFIQANRTLVNDIARGCLYFLMQYLMIIIYPVHYYGFTRIRDDNDFAGVAFFGLLPLIKIMNRRLFDQISRKTNGGADLTPIFCILNADVLGSLFVAFSIQFKPTIVMSALVAGGKFLQSLLSMYEFRADGRRLKAISDFAVTTSKSSGKATSENSSINVVERAANILEQRGVSSQSPSNTDGDKVFYPPGEDSLRSTAKPSSLCFKKQKKNAVDILKAYLISKNRVADVTCSQMNITGAVIPESNASLSRIKIVNAKSQEQREDTYTSMVRKLLYISEVVLLIDYVEVIIPVLYCLYLIAIFHLPNRVFYAQFAEMDEEQLEQTIRSVLLYTTFEVVSFAITHTTLRRIFGVSPFYQLSFVLSQHAVHVQSALLLWTTHSTQASLDHFGNDYSFRFEWLLPKTEAAN